MEAYLGTMCEEMTATRYVLGTYVHTRLHVPKLFYVSKIRDTAFAAKITICGENVIGDAFGIPLWATPLVTVHSEVPVAFGNSPDSNLDTRLCEYGEDSCAHRCVSSWAPLGTRLE